VARRTRVIGENVQGLRPRYEDSRFADEAIDNFGDNTLANQGVDTMFRLQPASGPGVGNRKEQSGSVPSSENLSEVQGPIGNRLESHWAENGEPAVEVEHIVLDSD